MQGLKRIAAFKKAKFIQRKKNLEKKKLEAEKELNNERQSNDSLSSMDDEEQIDLVTKLVNNRYLIIKFLGRGSYSKVWMAYDFSDKRYVALKIFNPEDYDDSLDEIEIMKTLGNNNQYIVKMYDHFDYYVEDYKYKQRCIVYEFLGTCLLDLLSPFTNQLSIENIKHIVRKMLIAMNNYYEKGIIHNDVKLENMMTRCFSKELKKYIEWFSGLNVDQEYNNLVLKELPDNFQNLSDEKKKKLRRKIKHRVLPNYIETLKDSILTYIVDPELNTGEDTSQELLSNLVVIFNDFGNSCSVDNMYDDNIQHRAYRPPENVIGNGFCQKSDVWSLGCIIYEIITDRVLFNVVGNRDIDRDRNHLSLMYQFIGVMPENMTNECGKSSELFGRESRILYVDEVSYSGLENEIKQYRQDLSDTQINEICDFLRLLLRYDPSERLSPNELLQQKWLKENCDTALHTIMAS
uniref:non-specific serine/threonine protein kinase n=1 Tax=viral metagenome TaxID=1070528 RepID=A0A6C0E7B4_9ZZZZ